MSSAITQYKTCVPTYLPAVTNTATDLKTKQGFLYKVLAFQPAANAATYLNWYNKTAANVSIGVTVPDYVQFIPAGASACIDDFNNNAPFFSTAISYSATTAAGGAVAPANAIQVSVLYA